MKTLCKHD